MNKRLCTLLLFVMCLFIISGCDNFGNKNNKPDVATVEEGFTALNECTNLQMEVVLKFFEEDVPSDKNEIRFKLEQTDDEVKYQLTMNEFTYDFYIIKPTDGKIYIIFEPKMLGIDYPGFVKGEYYEVLEAYFYGIEPKPEPPQFDPDAQEKFDAIRIIGDSFQYLINFVADLKNDYFDLNDDEYELNQKGKEEYLKALKDFLTTINGGEETELIIDSNIKIKTNETIVSNISVEFISLDYPEDKIVLSFDFDRFNEVELTIPKNSTSFKDFIEYLQNDTPSIEEF